MIRLQTLVKQPAEQLQVPFAVGWALAAVDSVSAVARGIVPASIALDVSAEIVDGVAIVAIGGGTDGESYLITLRAIGAVTLELIEAEMEVAVVDGAWAMPDGGVPYLTIKEFVDSFGLDEVVRMTDGSGAGRIDRPMLIAALRHAQGLVDINLGGRYAVPLSVVPDAIKTAIADIARARLYPRGAPDGVSDAAKSATRLLERISGGQLPLSIPMGEAPASAESDAPILIRPGRLTYPGGQGSTW